MYLQIKHKIQSVDPGLCLGLSQSCRSGKESDSKPTRCRCEGSCWQAANTTLRNLHCFREGGCVFSDRSRISCKPSVPVFPVLAFSTSWRHLSDSKAGAS